MHILLIEVITSYLYHIISAVLLWLFFFYLLKWLLSGLVLWGDSDNLLIFSSCNLGILNTLHKCSVFDQNLIPEFFWILQLLFLYFYTLPLLASFYILASAAFSTFHTAYSKEQASAVSFRWLGVFVFLHINTFSIKLWYSMVTY